MSTFEQVNTRFKDVNNDSIIAYFDTEENIITDDGWCVFEYFLKEDMPNNADIEPILIEHGCLMQNHRLEVWLDKPYEKSDMDRFAKCYQKIQELIKDE